jgi:hypothetical protein
VVVARVWQEGGWRGVFHKDKLSVLSNKKFLEMHKNVNTADVSALSTGDWLRRYVCFTVQRIGFAYLEYVWF